MSQPQTVLMLLSQPMDGLFSDEAQNQGQLRSRAQVTLI